MIILRWFITTLAIFALPFFVPGITVQGILTAVIVAACLVFLNMVVKPVVTILTLPLNIITLGLFSIIINGAFFWLITKVVPGFTVATFTTAIIGAFIISIITWITNHFIKD